MRKLLAAALAALPALTTPAHGQTYEEQRRWEAAQARYQAETDAYLHERDLYRRARERDGRGAYERGYGAPPPPPPADVRYDAPPPPGSFETSYDASRHYREDPRYAERGLDARDEVYRGSDGRYYCRRNDGTVGLVIGGAGGALLGNIIDGGRNRTAGTLIGGAIGAIVGKSVADQQNLRCR